MSLASALTEAILPVLSVAAVGYVLGSVQDIDVDGLNTVTIYVLTPALVFHRLSLTTITSETAFKVFAGVVAFIFLMIAVAEIVGRLVGETETVLGALVLTSVFPNAGNYGIPLASFAFGPVGESTAVLYITAQAVLMYTVGVYLASRGNEGTNLGAVYTVFKLPLVYAVVAAGVFRFLDVVPAADGPAMTTIGLAGDAAIPVMLLILGIQLANTNYGSAFTRVGTSNVLKLVVAPAVAAALVLFLQFDDQTVARVFVLASAMPAAITPLILSIEFSDVHGDEPITGPEYISTNIFTTTLASIPVLTLLIAILRAGIIV